MLSTGVTPCDWRLQVCKLLVSPDALAAMPPTSILLSIEVTRSELAMGGMLLAASGAAACATIAMSSRCFTWIASALCSKRCVMTCPHAHFFSFKVL